MASRKTYFGIGWPKASADPGAGPEDAGDQGAEPTPTPTADHSAPTVVDDQKVAEGLEQLRSWYQSDAPEASRPMPAPAGMPQARPTAVGHATGEPQMPARPIAPDPMRATMFGHDIHRFDFDAPSAAAELPPARNPTPVPDGRAAGRGARVADAPQPPRVADAPQPRPEAPQSGPAWGPPSSQPDPFRIADYLRRQAAQPHPPAAGWVSSHDETDPRVAPRTPIIVFVIGFAALTAAILLGLQSRDTPGTGAAAPAALPVPPPPAIDRSPPPPIAPPAPGRERTRDVAPERAVDRLDSVSKSAEAHRTDVKPLVPRVAPTVPPRPKPRPPVKADVPRVEEAADSPGTEPPPTAEAATGSPAGPADGAHARPPTQPSEPSHPAKSTDKKPRDKSATSVDTDSTLPPSLGE